MWEVAEWVILVIIAVIAVTQVIIPSFSSLPFFWLFRQSSYKKLVEAAQDLEDAEVLSQAREIEREALEVRLEGLGLEEEDKSEEKVSVLDGSKVNPITKARKQVKGREKEQ